MGRAPCCAKVGLHRGPWTPREDTLLTNYIQANGEGNWRSLPKKAGLLRCGKSCRLRWMNYLRPDIKRGNISSDEDDLIIRLHTLLGNRWSLIAGRLPGRTDNEIKNYWNTHLSKRPGIQGTNRNSTHQKVSNRSQRRPSKKRVTTKNPAAEESTGITKQKVHLPKPFRVRRNYSFEGVHNCNNGTNDNTGTCGSSSQEKGFSPEGTSSTSIDHHDDYHGLGFLMIDGDIFDDQRNDIINHDGLDDNNHHHQRDLNVIYEEYLAQLLKTSDGDHELHDQFELDSFAESLLI